MKTRLLKIKDAGGGVVGSIIARYPDFDKNKS
jgi:hypothetical protein